MTNKQKLFADTYLSNGMNARQAYYTVYGNTTNKDPAYPYTILARPDVKQYIQDRRQELYDSLNIDSIRVMEEIASIAFGEITEELSVPAKLKALELLSKNLNLQTQKSESKDVIEVQLVEGD